MIKKRDILKFFFYFGTGYTIVHGLLFLVILTNHNLYNQILYHYSENVFWYLIYFIFPCTIGIMTYLLFRNYQIKKWQRILFTVILIAQLISTFGASVLNYHYWGYAFRRPVVFHEISKASEVLTCTQVSNMDSTGIGGFHIVFDSTDELNDLIGRRDPYYGTTDRVFMVLQDISHLNHHAGNFEKVNKDNKLKIAPSVLTAIEKKIKESNRLHSNSYSGVSSGLYGYLLEFNTNAGNKFLNVSLKGREVANDHYPFYEFLFKLENEGYKLKKYRRFYTDIAGIEGIEIGYFGPLLSLAISIIGILGCLIMFTIRKIMIKNKE